MSIQLILTKSFEKKFKRLDFKLQGNLRDKLTLFHINPYHPSLNNHKLKGSKEGLRTINITGDIRLVFIKNDPSVYTLIDIDNHNNLYGN